MFYRCHWLFCFFAVVLSAFSLLVFGTKAAAEDGCITGQCHATLLKAKNVHPIAESCDNCHQSLTKPHPQKGKKTFKLNQDPPELCTTCHPPFGKKPRVHSPVKDGMCTTCHNPHSSDEPKLLAQPVKDLCLNCHPDKVSFPNVHGPTAAGDCTACHNPHESANKALVLQDGTELCLTCHLDMKDEMKKKSVHPALQMGCTSCHNPHGAPYRKLLSAEGAKLCFQCHPQIGEKVEKAKVVHSPIKTEKGCASCHSPHASNNDKLLSMKGKDLCLTCHKNIIKKNMTLLHGPINSGTCTPCHDPHGSQEAKLLIKSFSSDQYVPYSEKEYELCFTCHKRDLLRFPDTSFATGFRDGEKNLHFVHVNKKEKGRNCRLCHAIHGGPSPKLVAESAPFGKWELPLKFIKTDTGGACSPGCHKPYNYDRVTPGKAPETEKSKDKDKDKSKEKEKK